MRRFFRFTIRDLLWLTLVVGVALGWFVREASRYQLRMEAASARQEAHDAQVAAATARDVATQALRELQSVHQARKYLTAKLLEALERLGEFDPKVNARPDWAN